jgi:hypothetical protein
MPQTTLSLVLGSFEHEHITFEHEHVAGVFAVGTRWAHRSLIGFSDLYRKQPGVEASRATPRHDNCEQSPVKVGVA